MLVLSGASGAVSLFSCMIFIGTSGEIASASISLVTNGIVKMLLKTMGREKNKLRQIALLTKRKLSSIEKIIFKVLLNSDVSHEEHCINM